MFLSSGLTTALQFTGPERINADFTPMPPTAVFPENTSSANCPRPSDPMENPLILLKMSGHVPYHNRLGAWSDAELDISLGMFRETIIRGKRTSHD